jgi:PAS domain S-box-containing protein
MAEGVSAQGAAPGDPPDAGAASNRWDSTPLGPRSRWPQSLLTLVDLMEGGAQPMFIVWGRDRTLLYNDAYAAMLGDRHPGAFGRSFLDPWQEHAELLRPMVEQVEAGKAVHSPDFVMTVERDVRPREAHFAVSCSPVRSDKGQVVGCFGTCTETTALVAAERLRSEGMRRVAHMFENAPAIIAVMEGPDHVFTVANGAFRTLVGDQRELIGKPFRDALPETADFVERLDHTFATGEPFRARGARVSLRRGTGGELEERILDFSYDPIYTADRMITGIFGEGVDVTERVHAEEELRRLNRTLEHRVAEELELRLRSEDALRQSQKMEAIGQLTGGVAHDFNNLLTVIRSSADVLRRLELSEDRRRRYLDAISETADRAARLTSQLLAFARRQALRPAVFNLRDCIRSVADMLATVVGARIELVTDLECDECFVEADAVQFETALVNLAANARDAMKDEGRLTISVYPADHIPRVRVHAKRKGRFAAVSVSDTGSGIAPEVIEHIFEPFFTTKEVGRGTGLGLSQVYGFAKQSGGEVDVESKPGEGATFNLYLPRVDPPAEQAAPAVRPAAAGKARGHVLIVEDNEQVGSFSSELLNDLGYMTTRAANADEALRALEESFPGHYSVVFSDVVMPGMSGVELAQEIRRRWPDQPVVLTSGYSHELAQQGSQGFEVLGKPYSLEDLTRVLGAASR